MLSTEILHPAPAHSRTENPACGARRKLQIEDREVEKLKRELEQAETKKSSLATEMHRLELDRVRFEHERLIATRDFERFTQTVQALLQEQSDLVSALERGTQEVDQCRIAIETRTQDKIEKENILAQKQAASRELQQSVEAVEAAVTQSRIRNAALGEKNRTPITISRTVSTYSKKLSSRSTFARIRLPT